MISSPQINATSNKVILGGDSIGLQIESDIRITGKYQVDTIDGKKSPWQNSNIETGDKIIEFDNIKVYSLNDINSILKNKSNNETVNIILDRNGRQIKTIITIYESKDKKLSLGLYIKDKILGVGTLTFINPTNNKFACLGHSVTDSPSLENQKLGILMYSTVSGIRKANSNTLGEKKASLDNETIGEIYSNTNVGVFGHFSKTINNELIEVANVNEVKKGKAQIITVLKGNSKSYYDVEIIELERQDSIGIKGIKIKIVDKQLVDIAGGIVQGMSGSPIIQNGKLVGAISHVTMDNPLYGYGVYAEWMLRKTI